MRKRTREPGLVRAAEVFPLEVKGSFLSEDDRRLLQETFLRLAELWHSLPGKEAEECLLLLTTCRNRWYALNAMYAEAVKWSQEAGDYKGFADALDVMRGALSGNEDLPQAAGRAASTLEGTAECLSEFERKRDLFFNRFHEVHGRLSQFCDALTDRVSRRIFRTAFVEFNSGPSVEDHLAPAADSGGNDPILERLLVWFSLARPLTSLFRTYISEVLQVGNPHDKACADYIAEIVQARGLLAAYGYSSPEIPPATAFQWRLTDLPLNDPRAISQLRDFIRFCEQAFDAARTFLVEMLPGRADLIARFPLERLGDELIIDIRGRRFQRVPDALVFIADMRNSTGDRYRSSELKVLREQVAKNLWNEGKVHSYLIYDDCRVLACDSTEAMLQSVVRVWSVFESKRQPGGFAGMRIGAVCGEMLFGVEEGDWQDLLNGASRGAPMDSSHNTMARAARLMGLDKARWEETGQGELVRERLAGWSEDESLLFIDASLFERLPSDLREHCRQIEVVQFRGIGPKLCWAVPIPALSQMLASTA